MKKSANPVCSQCGEEPLSSADAADLQQQLLKRKNSYYVGYELLVFIIIIYLI